MSLSRAQPSLSVLRWLTTKCNCTLCILLMMLSVGNSWPLPIVSRRNRKVELSNLTKSLDGILKNEECSLWANNINMCLWNNVSITLSAALVCRWQKTISAEDFVFWAEIYYFTQYQHNTNNTAAVQLCTGSFIMMVWKFLLTAPKVWLQVTFWAYWDLTRCGPFDNFSSKCFMGLILLIYRHRHYGAVAK